MPLKHIVLAILVVAIWGFNFIFVKLSLEEFSPLFLCALRFLLASVPAIFFIRKPAAPFGMVVLYGLVVFALQFAFLFLGIHAGMTAGMASLIIQVQVFFSMFFAALILKEKPAFTQFLGAFISFMGICLVALHLDSTITLSGFILIMLASMTWGIGNLITKKLKDVNGFSLVIWGCFISSIPMFILAWFIEGSATMLYNLHAASIKGFSSLLYIVCLSTWFGYGVWNWLISRYPVSSIVPFALLVPVFGMLGSVFMLHEPMQSWKWIAAFLVIAGLYVNIMGPKLGLARRSSPHREVAASD